MLLWAALLAGPAAAQEQPVEGMTVRRIEFKGLKAISEGFVRRTIKTRESQKYIKTQVEEDLRQLLQTRKFLDVRVETTVEDNEAVVTFLFQEKPVITSVEIEGNKIFTDEELFKELNFTAGSVLDQFDVDRGRENIIRRYKKKGYYFVEVKLDEAMLRQEARVIYQITEGQRVRVRNILFEGVHSFPEPRLKLIIGTKTWFPLLSPGAFDEEQADRDTADLLSFYRGEGFLDARVGYRPDFTNIERTRLNLVFVIEEGIRYRVKDFAVSGNTIFAADRILGVLLMAPGDILREEAVKLDVKKVEDLYGEIGYVDTKVEAVWKFLDEPGWVTLEYQIRESPRSHFGRITIRGNQRTKDEVVRRELRFYPGEDYNTLKTRAAEQRLRETGLFAKATVTPLPPAADGERDALVEVEEAQTTNFIIGFGVSTDNGVGGRIAIENRNFDLLDWPRTWGEFFRGQAFRGDGQRAKIEFEPGTEVTRFRIDFTEPYLFDKPLRYDQSIYLFQRDRKSYQEQRIGFVPAISKRFDSGLLRDWAIEGALRIEGINISDLRELASQQIQEVKGDSFLTSIKGTIVHDTSDSRFVPTRGHRFTLGWEQVGALGGDYTFGRPTVGYTWYKTLRTDIFDRKSVLALRADSGYIVGDAPVFERFYGGGFGSIRGFSFRGISPRAGVFNDRVGGDFILLAGAEYSFPLYADTFRGVTFLDMGTVEKEFGITRWRASIGLGLRINLTFLGSPAPLVFDFGFPISEDPADNDQVFNFSFGTSF